MNLVFTFDPILIKLTKILGVIIPFYYSLTLYFTIKKVPFINSAIKPSLFSFSLL